MDHQLALDLYDTGISDAMYLAGLIVDDDKMSKKDLQNWLKKAPWSMISEYTVAWVAAEGKHGYELGLEWIESKDDKIASAGWATLAGIVSMKPDAELDIPKIKSLLQKIEKIVQGPTISFYESLVGKDVYLHSIRFHSYGIYYYSDRQPGYRTEANDRDWLLTGPIDKPAYFVAKVTSRDQFTQFPDVKLIKEEGGFIFLERLPKGKP